MGIFTRRTLRMATTLVVAGVAGLALAGCHESVTFQGFVWHDLSADGLQDSGEPGLADVAVWLYCRPDSRAEFQRCDSTRTDVNGRYALFARLSHPRGADSRDNRFQIEFRIPDRFRFTKQGVSFEGNDSDADPDTGRTGVLEQDDASTGWDAGVVDTEASIGDRVWRDLDGDGVQDPGEPGVWRVRVELLDEEGARVDRARTRADGGYSFGPVTPGSYRVRFPRVPEGLGFSPPHRGDDDAADSDADPDTGETPLIRIVEGQAQRSIDAGLTSLGAIGDFVWHDEDADGVQDPGEPGAIGLPVELLDSAGAIVATTAVDIDGAYLFTGVPAGEYRVRFSRGDPEHRAFSRPDHGDDDELDSDADQASGETSPIRLAAGEIDDGVDAGIVNLRFAGSHVGQLVWLDDDADGVQDEGEEGVEGVQVTLLDPGGAVVATTDTNDHGVYDFGGLAPGDYRVRFSTPDGFEFTEAHAGTDDSDDSDADRTTGETPLVTLGERELDFTVDAGVVPAGGSGAIGDFVWRDDGDGVQEAGEPGVPNVTVRLLDESGAVLATNVTEDGGLYGFSGLAAGGYRVRVEPPPGLVATEPNADAPNNLDSDILADNETEPITLAEGQTNDSIDAGLVEEAPAGGGAIGDFVWHDDGDGIQEPGEPGIPNVTVRLLDESGAVLATSVTDDGGLYGFSGLAAGSYRVRVEPPFPLSATSPDRGSDDGADSDIGFDHETQLISLLDGEVDHTIDAGLVAPN